jgi:ankyrin repeat protein
MKESYLSHELLPTVLSNLIKLKVNPKLVDKDGNTMLQRAVIAPNMPCFSLFIENGFDRNLQNEHVG